MILAQFSCKRPANRAKPDVASRRLARLIPQDCSRKDLANLLVVACNFQALLAKLHGLRPMFLLFSVRAAHQNIWLRRDFSVFSAHCFACFEKAIACLTGGPCSANYTNVVRQNCLKRAEICNEYRMVIIADNIGCLRCNEECGHEMLHADRLQTHVPDGTYIE